MLRLSSAFMQWQIHIDNKPYHCKECAKCFNWSLGLLQNQRSHAGVKCNEYMECGNIYGISC